MIYLIILILLSGCVHNFDPYSGARPGTMYHYSGNTRFECIKCGKKSNLYRLDKKDRVICKECFKKSNKQWLYY